jgi:hypothetical protein
MFMFTVPQRELAANTKPSAFFTGFTLFPTLDLP